MSRLLRLRIRNFRNIAAADVSFGARVSVFHGQNAQGKTNFLEAIYLLSSLQSFRTRRIEELIRRGEHEAGIRGEVTGDFSATVLGLDIDAQGKRALVDGVGPESAAAYLGVLRSVFFGPQDMDLPAGNLPVRRRYVDRAAFFAEPAHLERLKNFARALRQRNEALRSGMENLDGWSVQLARLSHEIAAARVSALEGLKGEIKTIHGAISGGREVVEVRIRSAEKCLGKGVEGILEALREDEPEDRKKGFTRHGPHRDRVEIVLDGREISTHASQGQRRCAALSMKLALLAWVEAQTGDRPLFLLDDPGSELDRGRLEYLGEFIRGWGGQTLISSVGPDDVPIGGGAEVFYHGVVSGAVSQGTPKT